MGEENKNDLYISGTKFDAPIHQIKLYAPSNPKDVVRESLSLKNISGTELKGTFYLKPRHWSRKKYKKYLMSLRCSRDYAERMCNMVASFKGKISYDQMLFYSVIFGSDGSH